jgi:hypothetical protein
MSRAINYEDKFQVCTTKETRRLMEDLLFKTMNEQGRLIPKAAAFERIVKKFASSEGVHA